MKCRSCKKSSNNIICENCIEIKIICNCGCGERINKYTKSGYCRKYKNQSHAMKKHYIDNPNAGKEHSETLKDFYSDKEGPNKGKIFGEETVLKHRARLIERYSNPIERLLQSKRLKGIKRNKVNRINISIGAIKAWTPERKDKQRLKYSNPKNHPMYGRKGSLSPNWNGGSSLLPYDENFTDEFKDYIRSRQNYICADAKLGNCSNDKIALQVHHINRNKQDTTEFNCIALCASHHTKSHNVTSRQRHVKYVGTLIGVIV